MILKKFLKFGKSSLDDSYKKDSYKEKSVYCCKNVRTLTCGIRLNTLIAQSTDDSGQRVR